MRTLLLLLLVLPLNLLAQVNQSVATAVRTSDRPRIDGKLDDPCWNQAVPITDFTQYDPVHKAKPRQKTVVRVLYDDFAVYIGAMMYDTAPDSILHQLGNRDDDLNTDDFTIGFDTYNSDADAYVFGVTAAGVQFDSRFNDATYNAVWSSAAQISDSGWAAEIKIPYSCLRFPKLEEQVWGMQIARGIRRFREKDLWVICEKGISNELVYWGTLEGIKSVKAPLRLSFTPYLALYGQRFPKQDGPGSELSGSYAGGLDLKYGINESYTLDMTLLPDFSQVQSDNVVKNITAFETQYGEYRPFFNEGIDLFLKGNHFYSRRIGKEPAAYNEVEDSLRAGEVVHSNPSQTRLLNATKFSGRGKKGTAIGIFNAITDNMYAEIRDSLGNTRKVLTEPLTNYNIAVIDQTLKNNSDVYLINTNVTRDKGWDDANVTGAGVTLNDKSNTWRWIMSTALSQRFHRNTEDPSDVFENKLGYQYALGFGKVKGNFLFGLNREQVSRNFSNNDFGLMFQNNETRHMVHFDYNLYEPFGKARNMYNSIIFSQRVNAVTQKLTYLEIEATNSLTTTKYLSIWDGIGLAPIHPYDYYEPRTEGRFYRGEPYYYAYIGFSSDYRAKLALDGQITMVSTIGDPFRRIEAVVTPLVRPSDHLFFTYTLNLNQSWNDKGYATSDSSGVIFGNRDLMMISNLLEARYVFMNNLSLSLRVRHYWSMGTYLQFYTLGEDGWLEGNDDYLGNHDYDFNYNAWNVDLMFKWQFAPGSSLEFTYKNAILRDESQVIWNYLDNIRHTFAADQLNSLSLKVLYYLDWQYFKNKGRSGHNG